MPDNVHARLPEFGFHPAAFKKKPVLKCLLAAPGFGPATFVCLEIAINP
jgi:hypothetical protein